MHSHRPALLFVCTPVFISFHDFFSVKNIMLIDFRLMIFSLQERGECEQGGEAVQGEGVEEGQLERPGLERVERCGRRIGWGGGGC